jgi:hypothetical protein
MIMMRRVRVMFAATAVVVFAAGCTSGDSAARLDTDRVQTGGVTIVLRHPSGWRRQLSPQNRHYSEATALFANFDLRDPCTVTNGGQGITCHDERIGTFPNDGVLVSVGWTSGGPGPHTADELLANGTPTTVGPFRATEVQDAGANCAGTGATHSIGYLVDTGASGQAAAVTFCWRGDDGAIVAQVHEATASLEVVR